MPEFLNAIFDAVGGLFVLYVIVNFAGALTGDSIDEAIASVIQTVKRGRGNG